MTNSRTAKNWRKRTGGVELELPSGNTALIKRPGMEKLLKAGLLPDSLTPIAMEHIRKAESGGRPAAAKAKADADLDEALMEQILQDPDQIGEIFGTFDRVTAMCVLEPKVALHMREAHDESGAPILKADGKPVWEDIPEDERLSSDVPEDDPRYVPEDQEPIYTDEVDSEDKQFIFQWAVGGTSDLEQFRREQAAIMEGA